MAKLRDNVSTHKRMGPISIRGGVKPVARKFSASTEFSK